MLLNTKHWNDVKDGNFIVGGRILYKNGIAYRPGEDYPKDLFESLYGLYLTDAILEKVIEDEPEPPKKAKKGKKRN